MSYDDWKTGNWGQAQFNYKCDSCDRTTDYLIESCDSDSCYCEECSESFDMCPKCERVKEETPIDSDYCMSCLESLADRMNDKD